MRREGDKTRRAATLAKHGLDFAEIEKFDWDKAIFQGGHFLEGEVRMKEIGRIGERSAAVVYVEKERLFA